MSFERLKGLLCFPINPFLLKLKLTYFLIYSCKSTFLILCRPFYYPTFLTYKLCIVWIAVFTYTSLISTQIISYQELAIIHAGVPACSILGPIFIGNNTIQYQINSVLISFLQKLGFVADKLGNYKLILMILTFLGGLVYLPVLWLQSQHQTDPTLTYIFYMTCVMCTIIQGSS